MNKTWIIARHEFLTTVRRMSYILLTLSFPVLGLLGMLIYQGVAVWGGEAPPPEEVTIGYVDKVGSFDEHTTWDNVIFVPYDTQAEATADLLGGEVVEYFIIPEDYLEMGTIERYTTERELELPGTMALVEDFLLANLLGGEVSAEVLARAQTPMRTFSVRLDPETGEVLAAEDIFSAFALPFIFALVFMISLFFTSGFLLQGVSEEKENRLMEILLSSVSPRQLLTGKVVGLGAAGLLQIVIWFGVAFILAIIGSSFIAPLANLTIPPSLIIFGIVYFILGYLFFGVVWVTVGSIGTTAREGSQLTSLLVLPSVIPLWLIGLFVANPDHVVFTVLTLIPVTAPVTAVMKLSVGALPAWELILSLAILAASVVGATWLAARVFRTFVLMYGNRPSMSEVWRYIREG